VKPRAGVHYSFGATRGSTIQRCAGCASALAGRLPCWHRPWLPRSPAGPSRLVHPGQSSGVSRPCASRCCFGWKAAANERTDPVRNVFACRGFTSAVGEAHGAVLSCQRSPWGPDAVEALSQLFVPITHPLMERRAGGRMEQHAVKGQTASCPPLLRPGRLPNLLFVPRAS
jgi:hypothetical protein